MWKNLYNTSSVSDGGTIYQVRNLINRTNLTNGPPHNADASEDIKCIENAIPGNKNEAIL